MLMETRAAIELRQKAARKWIICFHEAFDMANLHGKDSNKHLRALACIVLTDRTSDYLAEFDPMALKQGQVALNGKSWENYV